MANNEVAKQTDEYKKYIEIIALSKALMGGTRAMQAAGTKFLPQDPKEKDPEYQNRLNRTTLLPAYKRTINLLTGQVFAKSIVLPEELPESMAELMDDIDTAGNNLDIFCREVFKNGIDQGASCILVDSPPKSDAVKTKAQEQAAGIRPYFVNVKAENIIGCRVGKDGTLLQVRIKETVEIDDGDYGTAEESRIRVLEPGSYRVWRETSTDVWEVATDENGNPIEGATGLDYIPLVIFMPGDMRSKTTANPPLEDLAWANLAHWQSSSDQRNILHVARVPILFGKKLGNIDKVAVGAQRMLTGNDDNSDLYFVEIEGKAIAAGRQDLEDLKTEMALYGMQLMLPKTGDTTATEAALNSAESDSTLKSWALMFQDFLNTALAIMADYMSETYAGSVKVNTEFRDMLSGFTVSELREAANDGILAKEVVFNEYKRRGIIQNDVDWQENQTQIENESRSTGLFADLAGRTLGQQPEQ